jgi:hypothetical protein
MNLTLYPLWILGNISYNRIREHQRGRLVLPNVCFFSFKEDDRETVLLIKGRAMNPKYSGLDFQVKDLLKRWKTTDRKVIRRAISTNMSGTSRTIVFVGNNTWDSYWVPEEVEMTLENDKKCYAIRLKDTYGTTPQVLTDNGITLHSWSEATLQDLATR